MSAIEVFADNLGNYLEPEQVNLVRRAYFYAEQAHDGQTRRSGEPYVTHPLAVAHILADMHMDHQPRPMTACRRCRPGRRIGAP